MYINLEDGPQGVGGGLKSVTTWPSPLAVAATWDVNLMYTWGCALGAEQRGKGTSVHLGPDINIALHECLCEDPVLTAKLTTVNVNGVQSQGVNTTAKHFIDNDQEYQRDYISILVHEHTQ